MVKRTAFLAGPRLATIAIAITAKNHPIAAGVEYLKLNGILSSSIPICSLRKELTGMEHNVPSIHPNRPMTIPSDRIICHTDVLDAPMALKTPISRMRSMTLMLMVVV